MAAGGAGSTHGAPVAGSIRIGWPVTAFSVSVWPDAGSTHVVGDDGVGPEKVTFARLPTNRSQRVGRGPRSDRPSLAVTVPQTSGGIVRTICSSTYVADATSSPS
jgi:hypothetical protein